MPNMSIPGLGPLLTAMRLQTEALAMLPNTLVALNRSLEAFSEAMTLASTSMAAVQQLADRIDAMVELVEAPVRSLSPGVRRLAAVLDDPVIDGVPTTLRRMSNEVTPLVRRLADTEALVSGIASSTEHIRRLVGETGDLIGGQPTAAGRRDSGRPTPQPKPPAGLAEPDTAEKAPTKASGTNAANPKSTKPKATKPATTKTPVAKPPAAKPTTKPARRPPTGR